MLEGGGDGVISVTANVAPKEMSECVRRLWLERKQMMKK